MYLGCVCLAGVLLIVVLSKIAYGTSSLTVHKSSVVLIGERVEMNCSVTGSDLTRWMYTAWNTSHETRIYLNTDGNIVESMRSRYRIDKRISGQHNLIIDSVDLVHSGRYRCNAAIHGTLWSDALLTVLGCEPECSTNASHIDGGLIEHSYLWMWCRVNYTGSIVPIFSMTKENLKGDLSAYTSSTDNYSTPLTTTATVTTQLIYYDNGAKFTFRITFQLTNNHDEAAIVLYAYTWNYTATILYGPKNLSIVRLEDRLLCAADGNPNPIYTWTNFEANISTDGPVHLLNYTMQPNSYYTIECEAINALASERKNISYFQVPNKDLSDNQDVPDFLVTALAIGGSLIFLLMLAFVVSRIIHTDRMKDNTSHRPDVALHTDASSYDGIALSSQRSPNNIMKGDHLPGKSGESAIADNAVYAKVMKPKGPSKGNKGGNIGDSSRPQHARKDITGADGTVYAELSGVKPPTRKGAAQVPKTPAFNKVEIYASIDHSGNAPAPPLPPKIIALCT